VKNRIPKENPAQHNFPVQIISKDNGNISNVYSAENYFKNFLKKNI
jgi:hypothetical protein